MLPLGSSSFSMINVLLHTQIFLESGVSQQLIIQGAPNEIDILFYNSAHLSGAFGAATQVVFRQFNRSSSMFPSIPLPFSRVRFHRKNIYKVFEGSKDNWHGAQCEFPVTTTVPHEVFFQLCNVVMSYAITFCTSARRVPLRSPIFLYMMSRKGNYTAAAAEQRAKHEKQPLLPSFLSLFYFLQFI